MSGPVVDLPPVQLKGAMNRALTRTTGYELRRASSRVRRRRRPGELGDRLLAAPVFVMCSVRSGSTLLRVLLDSHSRIHAPQELHLRDMTVRVKTDYAAEGARRDRPRRPAAAVPALGPAAAPRARGRAQGHPRQQDAQRRLHRRPDRTCWPDARFIYLLRHPARSPARARRRGRRTRPTATPAWCCATATRSRQARAAHPGVVVRYEELTADPRAATQRICSVPRRASGSPAMLEYGRFDHGRMKPGLGDWKAKIKSGEVQPADAAARRSRRSIRRCTSCASRGATIGRAPAVQPAGCSERRPKVSVVVPVYNPGRDIDDCIRTPARPVARRRTSTR